MKNGFISLAIASSLAISLSAFANKGAVYQAPVQEKEQGAWYIGAGPNWNSQFGMDTNGIDVVYSSVFPAQALFQTEQTSADIGFDAYVGYDINKYWAVELGYTYVGNTHFESLGVNPTTDKEREEISIDTTVKQWNAHVVGMGKLPVGEYVNLFLKGGIAYFSSIQEYAAEGNFDDETLLDFIQATTDSLALTYGAGAELHWENWGLRGEYNVMWPANNVREDFYIADVISANIYYKFM